MYNNLEKIGGRLKEYRESRGYNQQQFADMLGIKQQSLSKYENGYQSMPDKIKLKLIDDNVNINWLLTGRGDMFKNSEENKTEHKKEKQYRSEENISKMHSFIGHVLNDSVDIKQDKEEWNSSSARYFLKETGLNEEDNLKNIDLIKVVNGIQKSNYAILIPEELRKYEGRLIAAVVNGDDMEPTIKKSSIVLCDVLGYRGAGIYIIKINDKYMIKRIILKPDFYVISSDNKAYESFEISFSSAQIKIGGQVRSVTNVL